MSVETVSSPQRPCIHCGDCARACPVALNPQALFFALVAEDWPSTQRGKLDSCTECRRCDEVCPSHIPLLDWLRWGNAELLRQKLLRERADAARARYEARNARLVREREECRPEREESTPNTGPKDAPAEGIRAATISKSDVLAAIARGRARRASRHPAAPGEDGNTP